MHTSSTGKTHIGTELIATALIILFFYSPVTKLLDMTEFRQQLSNQIIPNWAITPLLWLLPFCELLICSLIIFPSSRMQGLYGSALLLLIFTGYTLLVVLNVFDREPCSCAGVLKNVGFKTHLTFNIIFLTLSIVGIYRLKTANNSTFVTKKQ